MNPEQEIELVLRVLSTRPTDEEIFHLEHEDVNPRKAEQEPEEQPEEEPEEEPVPLPVPVGIHASAFLKWRVTGSIPVTSTNVVSALPITYTAISTAPFYLCIRLGTRKAGAKESDSYPR
jgi:hypothetical protein